MTIRGAVVIGTGLIGTSVALALRARGVQIWLTDRDEDSLRLAISLGAGDPLPRSAPDISEISGAPDDDSGSVLEILTPKTVRISSTSESLADVAVIAVPPAAVAAALKDAQARNLARVYTDVASVKGLPTEQAQAAGCDMTSFVPGHPLAGRERHGPAAARADLFLGRTWALCPSAETAQEAVGTVTELIGVCGGDQVITDPRTHDRWVALISHAPHVVAAAMAARLEHAPSDALALTGQGLRDTTRVAAGDPGLWKQILEANALPVARVLAEVAADLSEAAQALSASGEMADKLLERGRAGVARIPGKHGEEPRPFAVVQVVINDRPGELARLFNAAGEAGVNIEDIRIEHSPGLPVGVAELSVRPAEVPALVAAMQAGGWHTRG